MCRRACLLWIRRATLLRAFKSSGTRRSSLAAATRPRRSPLLSRFQSERVETICFILSLSMFMDGYVFVVSCESHAWFLFDTKTFFDSHPSLSLCARARKRDLLVKIEQHGDQTNPDFMHGLPVATQTLLAALYAPPHWLPSSPIVTICHSEPGAWNVAHRKTGRVRWPLLALLRRRSCAFVHSWRSELSNVAVSASHESSAAQRRHLHWPHDV